MRTSGKIFLNTLASWIATTSSALLGLILVPFLIGELGKAGYGLIGLTLSIVGLSTLIDLGIRGALGRHLAEAKARQDTEEYNSLLSTGFFLYLAIGSFLAVVCAVGAPWLIEALQIPEALRDQGIFLVRYFGGVKLLISFLLPPLTATITSLNRFDLLHAIRTGTSLLGGILVIIVLSLTDWGLYGWVVIMLLAAILDVVLQHWTAKRLFSNMCIRPRYCSGKAARRLLSLGGYLFTFQITTQLSVQSDPIVITSFLGPGALALYTPGYSMILKLRPLISSLASQLYPVTTHLHVTGQHHALQQVLLRGTRYTLLMGILPCTFLMVFAPFITQLWLGNRLPEGDLQAVSRIMTLWAAIDLVRYAAGTQWPVLLGMNRLRFLTFLNLPLSLVNLISSVLLVWLTPLGPEGVVIPTLVIDLIRRPITNGYAAYACGMRGRDYFWGAYSRPILVLLVLLGLGIWLRWQGVGQRLWELLTVAVGYCIVWGGLSWYVGLGSTDRRSIGPTMLTFLKRLWRKFPIPFFAKNRQAK